MTTGTVKGDQGLAISIKWPQEDVQICKKELQQTMRRMLSIQVLGHNISTPI